MIYFISWASSSQHAATKKMTNWLVISIEMIYFSIESIDLFSSLRIWIGKKTNYSINGQGGAGPGRAIKKKEKDIIALCQGKVGLAN